MNVLITGADGFLGRELAARLCEGTQLPRVHRLTLVGLEFEERRPDPRATYITGSIAEPHVLRSAVAAEPDLVFHLAAVTSAAAEASFEAGLQVNVTATMALLEALRAQQHNPLFVFPSTIAVFGPPFPAVVDDDTWPVPAMSYGAEKLACEVLIAEYARRVFVRGRSLRLPAIVARPPMRTGAASAFSSDLIRELAWGHSYVCPVSPHATHWLMSMPRCVDNLLHAAVLDDDAFGPRRVVNLPPVHVSTAALVDAIAHHAGSDVRRRLSYAPNPSLDRAFGSFPPMVTRAAEAAGLTGDGDAMTLVQNALARLNARVRQ